MGIDSLRFVCDDGGVNYSEGKPEMPNSLSNYDVTFSQNPLLGTWHWTAKKSPGGEEFGPLNHLGFISKEAAEANALKRIEQFDARETISGAALRDRVTARGTDLLGKSHSGNLTADIKHLRS